VIISVGFNTFASADSTMRRQAFIFSLDAFVAFTLIMLTINSLIASVSMPRGYYASLEQAYDSAKDTMQSLSKTTDSPSNPSYLEQIASSSGSAGPLIRRTADKMIPQQFGYRFEKYYLGQRTTNILYDSAWAPPADARNHTYTKLKVSYDTLVTSYGVHPNPGASPWCYLHCGDGSCDRVPCDPPIMNFSAGEMQISVIRLTVYT
jgi:hypothetical protein